MSKGKSSLVGDLLLGLLGGLLGLLLLLAEDLGDHGDDIGGNLELGGDDSLEDSQWAVTALLELLLVDLEEVVLALLAELDGHACHALCLLLQLSGLLLDNGELGVDPLEAFIAVLVGLSKVGCNV